MLSDLHSGSAWIVVGLNVIAGSWALAAHRWEQARRRELWWFTTFAQISIFVQVALGVARVALDDVEVAQFHAFYGFIALAAVGIVYSYRQQLGRDQLYLLYGFGGLFIAGLCARALLLSPVPLPGS